MESIQFARLPGSIVVVRVSGRGNHQNSLSLRRLLDETCTDDECPEYVFDLEKCTTMDSTFMGVMASIGLRQQRMRETKSTAVNLTAHVKEQLELLGLKFILTLREGKHEAAGGDGEAFSAAPPPEIGKRERIILMIEAHERLIDVDGRNEVKFRGVLQSLRESLKRAKAE